MVRLRMAGSSGPRLGMAGQGRAYNVRLMMRLGNLGQAGPGNAEHGRARHAWAPRSGTACHGSARLGWARLGMTRLGNAALGRARLGSAWHGSPRKRQGGYNANDSGEN